MKPTTRNGLIALILLVLAIDAGAVIARFRDDEPRTEVSSAPTTVPTSTSVATSTVPSASASSPAAGDPAGGGPDTTAAPATGGAAAGTSAATSTSTPASPRTTLRSPVGEAHPKTGGASALLPALLLIGAGLAGLGLRLRVDAASSYPTTHTNPNTDKEKRTWPLTS